jgi:hypothetical protein
MLSPDFARALITRTYLLTALEDAKGGDFTELNGVIVMIVHHNNTNLATAANPEQFCRGTIA